MSNLSSAQVDEWSKNVTTEIEKLSTYINSIKEIIETGSNGTSIIEAVKANDSSLADVWTNFALSIDAAKQKLDSQKEIFFSSLKTFTDQINQSNEAFNKEAEDTSVSFEDASNELSSL